MAVVFNQREIEKKEFPGLSPPHSENDPAHTHSLTAIPTPPVITPSLLTTVADGDQCHARRIRVAVESSPRRPPSPRRPRRPRPQTVAVPTTIVAQAPPLLCPR